MASVDPNDPASFNHRFVIAGKGHRYHVVDQPPVDWVGDLNDAPTLLLCHGFPDLWYGYRYREWSLHLLDFTLPNLPHHRNPRLRSERMEGPLPFATRLRRNGQPERSGVLLLQVGSVRYELVARRLWRDGKGRRRRARLGRSR